MKSPNCVVVCAPLVVSLALSCSCRSVAPPMVDVLGSGPRPHQEYSGRFDASGHGGVFSIPDVEDARLMPALGATMALRLQLSDGFSLAATAQDSLLVHRLGPVALLYAGASVSGQYAFTDRLALRLGIASPALFLGSLGPEGSVLYSFYSSDDVDVFGVVGGSYSTPIRANLELNGPGRAEQLVDTAWAHAAGGVLWRVDPWLELKAGLLVFTGSSFGTFGQGKPEPLFAGGGIFGALWKL